MLYVLFLVVHLDHKARYQTESMLFLLLSSIASFMNGLLARICFPHTTKRIGARDNANEMNARSVLAQLKPSVEYMLIAARGRKAENVFSPQAMIPMAEAAYLL